MKKIKFAGRNPNPKYNIMHIAIAGNIGSGKTTLTKMLAAHYNWTPRFESVDYNPYLADFYEDMERWSFNLQIYFLNKRFKDVVEIAKCKDVIIQTGRFTKMRVSLLLTFMPWGL